MGSIERGGPGGGRVCPGFPLGVSHWGRGATTGCFGGLKKRLPARAYGRDFDGFIRSFGKGSRAGEDVRREKELW